MSLILIVEPESRYVERIRDALVPFGWSIDTVADAGEALGHAASQAPTLVLINVEAIGADHLLETFGRKTGGPGTIAVIPEKKATDAGLYAARSDACLLKPFTDDELRRAVQQSLDAAPLRPAASTVSPAAKERKLTSQDLFGDLIAELDGLSASDKSGSFRALKAEPPAERPAPRPAPTPSQRTDSDIDRKLEETLSGVLGALPGRTRDGHKAEARPASGRSGARKPRAKDEASELEELINTRLGLDLSLPRTRANQAAPKSTQAPPLAPTKLEAPSEPDAPLAPPLRNEAPMGAVLFEAEDLPLLEMGDELEAVEPGSVQPVTVEPSRTESPFFDPDPDHAEAAYAPDADDILGREPEAAAMEVLATQRISALGTPSAQPGTEFGQYLLLEKVAVGGMAELWKARMQGVEGFQKVVAIKKILPHLNDNSAFVTMFIDEAKLAAQLNHPHITHIYDLGRIAGEYFIAMEYVDGRNLRAILNEARRKEIQIPRGLALLIASRLASALDYAHRKKDFDDRELALVHRDVSPQNVLISYEGDIKLCDFGIVKAVSKASHTQMGALKGKLQYMSPEQAWGKSVDARSDLFSLGALLFETLSGRRLFPGENEISVLEAVREARIEPLDQIEPPLTRGLTRLLEKVLQKNPASRYQSAGELQQDLEKLLYEIRPTPTQADLAVLMQALFLGGERSWERGDILEPSAAAVSLLDNEPASRLRLDSEVDGAPPPLAPAPDLPAPPQPDRVAAAAASSTADLISPTTEAQTGSGVEADAGAETGVDAVPGVAPAPGEMGELEEGGSRGKGDLIAAILALLIIGLAVVWLVWLRPGATPSEPVDPTLPDQEEAISSTPVAGASQPEGEAGTDHTAGGPDTEAELEAVPEGDADEAPARLNVAQMVEEEVARREEELRRKLAAEEQRLAAQLAEAQRRPAPKEPAPQGSTPTAAEATKITSEEEKAATLAAERQAAEAQRLEEERLAEERLEKQRLAEQRRLAEEAEEERKAEEERNRVKVGQLVRLGPGVTPPQLVSVEKPQYPPIARRLRIEGEVEVEVLVDETGRVENVRVTKPSPRDAGLNEAAVAAAQTARFRPATKEGVQVKVWTKLKIPFKL